VLAVVGQDVVSHALQSSDSCAVGGGRTHQLNDEHKSPHVAADSTASATTSAAIGRLQRELELREEQQGTGAAAGIAKNSFTYKDYMLSASSLRPVAETRSKLLKFSSIATNRFTSLTAASIAAVEELLFDEDGDPLFKTLHQNEVMDRLHYAAELYLQKHPEKIRERLQAAKTTPKRRRSIWYKFAVQVVDPHASSLRKVAVHRMHRRRKAAPYPDAWGRTDTPPADTTRRGMAEEDLNLNLYGKRHVMSDSRDSAATAVPPVALPLQRYIEQLQSLLQRPVSKR
jgi:hypothetical protein